MMITSLKAVKAKTKSRNEHIDIAKGLGILIVVLGHNWLTINQKGELFNILFSVSMPLFFFLSGIFFNPLRSFWSTIATKTDTLLKPYFVTLTLVAIPDLLLRNLDFFKYIAGVFYGTGSAIKWEPLWFLPHLFIVTIFAWILCFALKKIKINRAFTYLSAISLLLIGATFIDLFSPIRGTYLGTQYTVFGLPLSLDLVLITIFYFSLGYELKNKVTAFRVSKLWALTSLLLFIGCHYCFDSTIDLNKRIYGNVFVSTTEALCGIYILLCASRWIQSQKILVGFFAIIGRASLFVLIFHDFFQSNSFELATVFLGEKHVLSIIFSFVAGSILPVLLWLFVKRVGVLSLLYLPLKSNKMIQQVHR